MSVLSHPLWPTLRPFFHIEVYDRDGGHKRPRVRIELRALPPDLKAQALAMTMPCVACGTSMHPIRARRPPGNKRSEVVGQHCYYAAACPHDVNRGCANGHAAREEYEKVKVTLRPDLFAIGSGGLPGLPPNMIL